MGAASVPGDYDQDPASPPSGSHDDGNINERGHPIAQTEREKGAERG